MEEERSCSNCGIDLICQECNEDDSNWQPIAQEKPIENKVIFESEKQFVNFWKDLTGCDCLPGTREKIKQKGYIRKSAVEQAEESCENSIKYLKDQSRDSAIDRSINDIEKYIQELKSEIERLKK